MVTFQENFDIERWWVAIAISGWLPLVCLAILYCALITSVTYVIYFNLSFSPHWMPRVGESGAGASLGMFVMLSRCWCW